MDTVGSVFYERLRKKGIFNLNSGVILEAISEITGAKKVCSNSMYDFSHKIIRRLGID